MPDITPIDLHTPAHAAALLQLLDHYAQDPMGGGAPLMPDVRALLVDRLRERTDYVGHLAWEGEMPIGLINCFEGFSTFAARPLLNVHDIVVARAHRGRGVGRALLAAAEESGRARGCCKLTLEVLDRNANAMDLYRRCGFAPYVLDPAAGQAVLLQKWLAT